MTKIYSFYAGVQLDPRWQHTEKLDPWAVTGLAIICLSQN